MILENKNDWNPDWECSEGDEGVPERVVFGVWGVGVALGVFVHRCILLVTRLPLKGGHESYRPVQPLEGECETVFLYLTDKSSIQCIDKVVNR